MTHFAPARVCEKVSYLEPVGEQPKAGTQAPSFIDFTFIPSAVVNLALGAAEIQSDDSGGLKLPVMFESCHW
jgi:hypothetical protein